MLPRGADAVVMWEHTRESGDVLEVNRPVAPGEHIVTVGEDVREGETVLTAGHVLRPADVGLLAGIGVTEVAVARRPRVAIISTGDELVGAEEEPGPGQVRNVNQYSLGAWVRHLGCEPLLLGRVRDDADQILALVRRAVAGAELVLISGGSSAGARDLTRAVVESLGEPGLLFHGVAVRPGKPTVVGAHRGVPVFGLPGHPISAMVIFLVLVRPLLERLLGIPPGEAGSESAGAPDGQSALAGRPRGLLSGGPAPGGRRDGGRPGLSQVRSRLRDGARPRHGPGGPRARGARDGRTCRGRSSRMSDGGGRGRRYLRRLAADEARRLLFERMAALVPHRASEIDSHPGGPRESHRGGGRRAPPRAFLSLLRDGRHRARGRAHLRRERDLPRASCRPGRRLLGRHRRPDTAGVQRRGPLRGVALARGWQRRDPRPLGALGARPGHRPGDRDGRDGAALRVADRRRPTSGRCWPPG